MRLRWSCRDFDPSLVPIDPGTAFLFARGNYVNCHNVPGSKIHIGSELAIMDDGILSIRRNIAWALPARAICQLIFSTLDKSRNLSSAQLQSRYFCWNASQSKSRVARCTVRLVTVESKVEIRLSDDRKDSLGREISFSRDISLSVGHGTAKAQ